MTVVRTIHDFGKRNKIQEEKRIYGEKSVYRDSKSEGVDGKSRRK